MAALTSTSNSACSAASYLPQYGTGGAASQALPGQATQHVDMHVPKSRTVFRLRFLSCQWVPLRATTVHSGSQANFDDSQSCSATAWNRQKTPAAHSHISSQIRWAPVALPTSSHSFLSMPVLPRLSSKATASDRLCPPCSQTRLLR